MAGGLLLGVAATLLIGSVGTHPQQAQPPPATNRPAEGTPLQGAAPPVPTTAAPGRSTAVPSAGQPGPPACAPGVLGVSVAGDRPRYRPGETVTITSSVVDRSARACAVLARCAPPDVFAVVRAAPGGHSTDWYESRETRACTDSVTAHVLQPGQPLVERETVMAAMPKGGPSCGTAGVDLTAQVFLLGADQLVHAVQGTGALTVVASPCPAPTRRGPLGS